jgi:transposase
MTPANVHDSRQLVPLIDAIPPVRGKVGAPKRRPAAACADKAYDSRRLRQELQSRGIDPEIPRRGSEDDPLGLFRWPVERTLAWYHQFRRLKLCYEKGEEMHQAFLDLATCFITYRRFRGVFC